MRTTIARQARQIFWTVVGPRSAATFANRTFPRMDGTYHKYSASELATETCPTAATPSMGPSIQASQRTRMSERITVTQGRSPLATDRPHPSTTLRHVRVDSLERDQIQMAPTLM